MTTRISVVNGFEIVAIVTIQEEREGYPIDLPVTRQDWEELKQQVESVF